MARKMGPPTILTQQEEDQIEEWIVKKAMLGFPLHPEDVKDSIQGLLTESPRENPFTNNRPGIKWFNLFLKRHPEIKKRNTEVISKCRAEVTNENLEEWFNELNNFLVEHDCEDIFEDSTRGRRVLNLDETGCLTCPKTGKVLGPKQLPDFYEVTTGSEKLSITVLCTYSADGSALPPMVVYPHKKFAAIDFDKCLSERKRKMTEEERPPGALDMISISDYATTLRVLEAYLPMETSVNFHEWERENEIDQQSKGNLYPFWKWCREKPRLQPTMKIPARRSCPTQMMKTMSKQRI
ncbi:hypothetical protein GE061_008251 [Apolygus lucorum]|uniref:HTH CENPB-type domain-containing protein n=1 Tax=Apolygus lucorum TaxID=248454 RepID=A0A8S9WPD3_APOLU|nr:hypothetical protein GE061_008251 [Apolygus lucorum]